jgi:DUF1365 family protein
MTGDTVSAIYRGVVAHTRLRPVVHRLRYPLFWLLLDLDELPALHDRLRLFSADRFNLFGFYARDHLDPAGPPLRTQIAGHLAAAGIAWDGGAIRVLCMPRVLGFVFNPLSVFFCHQRDGRLAALLYEVNNTFGERHSYLIPVADPAPRVIRQECAKAFHVSPFMDMALRYAFRVVPPAATAVVVVQTSDAAGPLLGASFAGSRQPLTDPALLRLFARFGLLGAQVLGAIHWEALKLWRKGVPLHPRPAPPPRPVTALSLPKV